MLAIDEMIDTQGSVQAPSSHEAGSPDRVRTADLPVARPSTQQGRGPIPLVSQAGLLSPSLGWFQEQDGGKVGWGSQQDWQL